MTGRYIAWLGRSGDSWVSSVARVPTEPLPSFYLTRIVYRRWPAGTTWAGWLLTCWLAIQVLKAG